MDSPAAAPRFEVGKTNALPRVCAEGRLPRGARLEGTMSRSTRSGRDDSTARAFVRVGFPKLVEKLYRYATGTLRLAAIDAERADMIEAVDLVNTLMEKSLSGAVTWDLPEHASDDEVVGYACRKLYGMRSTLRRRAALTVGDEDDAIDGLADEAPDALSLLAAQEGARGRGARLRGRRRGVGPPDDDARGQASRGDRGRAPLHPQARGDGSQANHPRHRGAPRQDERPERGRAPELGPARNLP